MIYDFAIIGGGSAGLSLAAAAAQFGEKVVLFEKGEMGGDCLNYGCVPSKALIAAAKVAQAQRISAPFGIAATNPKVDYTRVMDHVAAVISKIAPFDSQKRFEGLRVKVIRASARFTGPRTLEADGQIFEARKIIIATGSRAALPPIPGLKDAAYFTNETIFKNRVLPKHLIIIGAGPVGLELAQAHRRLGSKVTVLEALQPLSKDDPELAKFVIDALQEEGVNIQTGVDVAKIESTKAKINVVLKDGKIISGSHLLVAAGRSPNIESLNLEAAGIAFSNRGITVDQSLRTSNRNVYAAGDVAGGLQFTHVANYHAGLIIRNAMFRFPIKNRTDMIPWVTYTDPELAQVGLTEPEAIKNYRGAVKVLRWPFTENDRAQTECSTKGLVKIIIGKRGRILGASIVGANAGELIAFWALALSQKLSISAIANLVLPYPTRSEAGKRAAVSNYAGLAQRPWVRKLIHILKLFG